MNAASVIPTAPDRRWFAVFTLPQKEATAHLHLRNQAFNSFLPQRRKMVRHARKTLTRLSPVFPRYLFVQLDQTRARWRSINGTVGVAHLVTFGGGPTPVPRGVVEALLLACDENGAMAAPETLQVGQAVRVAAGPFADLVGTIDRLDGPEAVRILLEIMGRQVEVRTDLHNVLPAI